MEINKQKKKRKTEREQEGKLNKERAKKSNLQKEARIDGTQSTHYGT